MFDIVKSAQKRYSAKAFDSSKKLSADQISAIKQVIRLSPSSINCQAWHFIIATSDEAKARIGKACPDHLTYNAKKIQEASLVVVFCAKTAFTYDDIAHVMNQEFADGRFKEEEAKNARTQILQGYTNALNKNPEHVVQTWLDKQTYIALGNALLAAADMDIDSVPIEGFINDVLDAELGLAEKGLKSTVIAAFGYHSDEDFNADLPKSRLPESELFTEI